MVLVLTVMPRWIVEQLIQCYNIAMIPWINLVDEEMLSDLKARGICVPA